MPRRKCSKRCMLFRFVKWQLGRVTFRSEGALALLAPSSLLRGLNLLQRGRRRWCSAVCRGLEMPRQNGTPCGLAPRAFSNARFPTYQELNLWLNVRGTISTDVYSRTCLCSVPGSLLRKEVRGPSDIILWARVPNENSQLERALLLFTFLSYCLRNLFLIALKVYLTDYVFSDILSGLKDLIFSYKTEL